jgi:hypothetical protein
VIVTVGATVYHEPTFVSHTESIVQFMTVTFAVAWVHQAGGADIVTVGVDEYQLHQAVTANVSGLA